MAMTQGRVGPRYSREIVELMATSPTRDEILAFHPSKAVQQRARKLLDNLAWTCFACNRRKGTDLASIDPLTDHLVRLFHPRRDRWNEHFRWEGILIKPLTAVGRVTVFFAAIESSRSVDESRILFRY